MTHSVSISGSDQGGTTLGVRAGQSHVADVVSPGEGALDLEQGEVITTVDFFVAWVHDDFLNGERSSSGSVTASSHHSQIGGR